MARSSFLGRQSTVWRQAGCGARLAFCDFDATLVADHAALCDVKMMDEFADARKLVRRTCSIGGIACHARHRIKQKKHHKPREKPADMRLPGDARAIGADRDRAESEDDVDTEPDREED